MPGFEPLSKAIRAAMLADTGSGGLFQTSNPLLTGVYTFVREQDMQFPFAVISLVADVDVSDFERDAFELRVQVSMYARADRGVVAADRFVERMRLLFHRQPVTVDDYAATRGRMVSSLMLQEDTEIYHRATDFQYFLTRNLPAPPD